MAFVLSVFAGRLVQLQWLENDAYAAQAAQQRLVSLNLPANRGTITDAHGQPLAMTMDARAVFADPGLVEPGKKDEIAGALAPLLDVPAGEIREKLDTPGRFVYLAREVSPERAQQILKLGYRGIATQPDHDRIYPSESLGANVIGLVGRDGHGLAGIEYALDRQLAGRDGRQTVEIGRNGQPIPMSSDQRRPPKRGRDVRLTIDRDIQWKAERAIADQVEQSGADSGTVAVMEPSTGQILGLATAPSFDPNLPDEASPDKIGNRAVTDVYEPGSTNKVITAAAALETGAVTPKTPFTVPPTLRRAGTTFHDSSYHPTEQLTFAGVLAKSSNIGTLLTAERIGSPTLYQYLRKFGFGGPSGLGLPGESPGLLPPPEDWSASQHYTVPFGQGVSANTIQMASVFATIAAGGVRAEPSLIAGTTDEEGTYQPAEPSEKRRVIGEKTARQLSRMLEKVVSEEGTAPAAQIPGYRVAGKTGTAQRVDPACGCYRGYTATFVGFAPADDPELVVQVVLQNPKRGHYGGVVAAPVFKDVMSFALKSRKIPPSGTKPPDIRLYARP
ncbi:MAG: penicillin-binding protein 2 [Streptosporangiales bacterium]|nr:penicillin-binding protein 2 [Streptosporangiales bacterium]